MRPWVLGGSRLVFPVLFLLGWAACAAVSDPLLIPSPGDTWQAVLRLAGRGDLWLELGISLRRVAIGVVLGALTGIPFGVALGASKRFSICFGAALPGIAATSSAIWAVLGVLWFGLSDMATIFVVAMTAAPLFAVNARDGVRAVDADLVQMAQSMDYGVFDVTLKILLPSVLPAFFSGGRLAIGFGWRVGLVAEALGSPTGVGFRLKQAVDLMHTPEVFAWSLSVILLMVAFEGFVLDPIERHSFRWRKPDATRSALSA